MKLVIAEKPSVAFTITKVIGSRTRKNGYYKGGRHIVSWCIGHLIKWQAQKDMMKNGRNGQ